VIHIIKKSLLEEKREKSSQTAKQDIESVQRREGCIQHFLERFKIYLKTLRRNKKMKNHCKAQK